MVVIGIDLGLSGALAVVGLNGAKVHDLPVTGEGKDRRLDGRALILLIRELVPADGRASAVFEHVHAGMGPGSVARASLMRSRGVVEAALDIARIPWRAVQPATWKRHYALIKEPKQRSLEVALRLYPDLGQQLKRAKDHNRGEAVLMAHYGARELEGLF
jgi:crossover junction endodeoxyribonuclease RuvC